MVVFIVLETPIGGEEKIIKIELLEELNFTDMTPGKKFRDAIKNSSPLIIPGAINAYSAKLAEKQIIKRFIFLEVGLLLPHMAFQILV